LACAGGVVLVQAQAKACGYKKVILLGALTLYPA
jgi:hypothetical protein